MNGKIAVAIENFHRRLPPIDLFLAVLLLMGTGLLIAYEVYRGRITSLVEISAAVFFACAYYLTTRSCEEKWDFLDLENHYPAFVRNTSLIFFSVYIVALLSFFTSTFRSQLFFLLIACLAGILFFQIVMSRSPVQHYLIFAELTLFAIMIRGTLLFESPGFFGVDPWDHAQLIEVWIREGHFVKDSTFLPGGGLAYSEYPLYHSMVMITSFFTQLPLRSCLFLSIGLSYPFSLIFIYLIVQRLMNPSAGLFAVLLLAVNQFHVVWGAWIIPTTLGVVLFSISAYLFLLEKFRPEHVALTIILFVYAAYSHTFSSLVIFIFLAILVISKSLFQTFKFPKDIKKQYIPTLLVVILGIIVFSKYIYLQYYSGLNFLASVLSPLESAVEENITVTGTAFIQSDYFLNRMSFLILIFFSVLGVIVALRNGNRKSGIVVLVPALAGLFAFSYLPASIGIDNLLPGRWIVFGITVGVLFTVIGFLHFPSPVRSSIGRVVLIGGFVILFSWFSLNSISVNSHTPFYGADSVDPIRNTFNDAEMSAAAVIATHIDGSISTDGRYASGPIGLFRIQQNNSNLTVQPMYDPTYTNAVAIRKYIVDHPSLIISEDQNFFEPFRAQRRIEQQKVFSNGDVTIIN